MTQEWINECMKYYGRVLNGKFGHFCYEWDGLPIDETCEEYKCCSCYANQGEEDKRSVATEDASSTDDDKIEKENYEYERGNE